LVSFFPPRSAYKLGKKKRSYNQVELTFERQRSVGHSKSGSSKRGGDALGSGETLRIFEAGERTFREDVPEGFWESALEYELKLYNGELARAVVYLVYAEPVARGVEPSKKSGIVDGRGHTWVPVTRDKCVKGCEGPILSAIQRFGKQGRTQKSAASQKSAPKESTKPAADDKWKDSRNLFISIDEASNHVCANGPDKCKVFRLLFGVYTHDTNEFLGSGVSGPIRVLANNDVPKGAAAMRVRCALSSTWKGWDANTNENEDELREHFRTLCSQPAGKSNHDKLREKRALEDSVKDRKPLANKTNTVKASSTAAATMTTTTSKRAAVAKPAAADDPAPKRAKASGRQAAQKKPAAQAVREDALPYDINMYDATDAREPLGIPPPESNVDLEFNITAMIPSPLGTPPDGQHANYAGLFGTPEYLNKADILRDGLNTAELPSLCTPGDKKQAAFQADMPPPTTGGMGHMRFTPGTWALASTGSLMSLPSFGSLGMMGTFGQTPAEFKAKTISKVFTRSAKKVAGPGRTPPSQFLKTFFCTSDAKDAAAPASTVRKSTRVAKKEIMAQTAPKTTAASKPVVQDSVNAPLGPQTGVASALGVDARVVTFDDHPARIARSRHASPTGVAPTRLLFSPVGRGGEPLEVGSDDDVPNEGFTSPDNGLAKMPRIASARDDLVSVGKDRASKRRLSAFVRQANAPVASGRRLRTTKGNAADLLQSPAWPNRTRGVDA
jgi:hypothetical protein